MFLQTSLLGGLGPSFSLYVSSNTSSTVDISVAATPFCCLLGLWFLVSVSVILNSGAEKRMDIGYSISYTHSNNDLRAGSKQINPIRREQLQPRVFMFSDSDSMHPIVNYAFVSGIFSSSAQQERTSTSSLLLTVSKRLDATGVYR